ncbi:MAG TPA: aminotransferase class V-fold PLP-dependent enzyme [Candidatus Bathyarchaeia archaeon]|nr:aminotransferase class V-fold PLP-dependent enzyme [Candidatus Bathyarchaeia archaeon]
MILLAPGPVNVSPRVTAALARGDMCHREPEFHRLLDSIRAKLVAAFAPRADYCAIPITGSGTLALEAAVSSSVSPGRRLMVVANGVYGERILDMARAHAIEAVALRSEWTSPPDLDRVAEVLAEDPAIEVVAVVHHETTTGLRNPLEAIGRTVRQAGRILLVDAISALAGEVAELDAWGIDVCVGVANKCIQGLPGAAFVLARRGQLERMAKLPARSVYMHLPAHHAAHEQGSVPFTAAVQVFYAFDEALDELLEESVTARIARYAGAAHQLRRGFARLGLERLLPEELCSNSITTLALPPGQDYPGLHDRLKADGFVIYAGQGRLSRSVFRVANMGALEREDFVRFLDSLGGALDRVAAQPALER